jgi:3-phenylpropionate/cinnamic acid dioxygenase small subunit
MLTSMPTNAADARTAIENLIYAYAERLDLGDFDGVGALFADADYGPAGAQPVHGADAVARLLRDSVRLHGAVPATKHVTTNVIVEVEEESAVARSYFSVFQAVGSRPPEVIVQGRYHDRFVVDGGRWRFAVRTIYMDALGDVSRHLTFDVGEFVGR